MEPLISVIIPVYNVEQYITECVDSVIKQKYRNLEIILVDDGSTDNSGTICDRISNLDERIKVIHKANGGLSDARNSGMKIANGKYLLFLDSDDYLPLSAISTLYHICECKNADIVIGKMIRTSERGELDSNQIEKNIFVYKSENALIEMLYGNKFNTSACGKLFRRELFNDLNFPFGKFSEDLFTIYKTILNAKRIIYTNHVTYFYYYRYEGSLVVSKYYGKHIEAIEAVDCISKSIDLENKEMYNAISNQYINVIYDIASRNPSIEEFENSKIINPLRTYRKNVLFNRHSPIRLRIFAFLSYLGFNNLIRIVSCYNHKKWKNKAPR